MKRNPTLNLLLVEDEPADAFLIRLAFDEGRVPVTLHHVLDGEEALAFLRSAAPHQGTQLPDLILLDLNLPCMNGRTFLQQLKSEPRLVQIPVVVLSTSDSEADLRSSYALNAAGYITKPIDVDTYIQIVQGLYQYWGQTVRLPNVAAHMNAVS